MKPLALHSCETTGPCMTWSCDPLTSPLHVQPQIRACKAASRVAPPPKKKFLSTGDKWETSLWNSHRSASSCHLKHWGHRQAIAWTAGLSSVDAKERFAERANLNQKEWGFIISWHLRFILTRSPPTLDLTLKSCFSIPWLILLHKKNPSQG